MESSRLGNQCYSDTWLGSDSPSDADLWGQEAPIDRSQNEGAFGMQGSSSDAPEFFCADSHPSFSETPVAPETWQRSDSSDFSWSGSEDESGDSWLKPWDVGCQGANPESSESESGRTSLPLRQPREGAATTRVPSGTSAGNGDVTADVTILPATALFREYRVEEIIGEGRYGTIWKCVSKATGERFACKQVDKGIAMAVDREVLCLAAAQGHLNVLRLEGVFESNKFVYILTEFCDSGDLFDVISRRVHLSEPEARHVFTQLLAAVAHCHARGVLHRDLKPENVLLHTCEETGQTIVKLADFGLSTVLVHGESALGWVGSKPYDAPEVSGLRPYSFQADIYSLGVVLFAMLSGNWPTRTESGFCPDNDFVFPVWRDVSAQAKRMVSHMLAQDPLMRPSGEELLFEPWLYPVS